MWKVSFLCLFCWFPPLMGFPLKRLSVMKRQRMTRKGSRKSFRKGTQVHPLNQPIGSRGGIRL